MLKFLKYKNSNQLLGDISILRDHVFGSGGLKISPFFDEKYDDVVVVQGAVQAVLHVDQEKICRLPKHFAKKLLCLNFPKNEFKFRLVCSKNANQDMLLFFFNCCFVAKSKTVFKSQHTTNCKLFVLFTEEFLHV